jgi:Mg2+ and Co2+ transporter CorA
MKWINEHLIDDNTHSFVYMISNISKNRIYIGKKIIKNTTKKRISKREKTLTGTRKTFKYVVKESNWRVYTGSSKDLNEDIKSGDIIERRILKTCQTKKQASYYEIKYQFEYNVLETDSYNLSINGVFYKKDLI